MTNWGEIMDTTSISLALSQVRRISLLTASGLLLAASLAGCAGQPATPADPDNQRAWVLGGAGELGEPGPALVEPQQLLEISEEMRQFTRQATVTGKNEGEKIRLLVEALHADDGLALRYDATATLTPQDAFAQRRANCMTHTLLFIALARDIGIDARFNHVEIPPIWDMRGDHVVLYRHINARIGASQSLFRIVDLTPEEYDPAYRQWTITDTEAAAQFFNNRAVDLQAQGQAREGLRYQLRAIELDPEQSFLWSNLGHLYLGIGNVRAAEISIRTALKLDPDSLSAYGTATRIYEALGEHQRALNYRRQAEYLQRRNPYYHYQLAEQAFARNQPLRALDESKKAISLYPEDHRFFLLLGAVLSRLDKPELARKSIEVAITLTADENLRSRYRSKLDRIAAATKPAPG
ncbi:MAG: hypothetical protein JWQ90_5593 [Hydrocarboniphaga sp.]|uniref:transglutaminase domain-containing protein n=1 Tax=Hydrocarboniphaga sp. TaxID=2033016 RepID=UPI00261756A9|nr:transglutaminase domain-containing protein [Hydrocarboniphaga sp.]MDB5973143.1 hypothetical protein [Hydrocarboniphaga sp.]